jgi:predicted enzyme related to lactoylglutathione lyase
VPVSRVSNGRPALESNPLGVIRRQVTTRRNPMEKMKNSLNWFEIPVSDFERAKAFYSKIYDYDMPAVEMGPNKLGFFLVEQGGIGGAIAHGPGYEPSEKGALVYLNGGADLQVVLERVQGAGGKVLMQKTQITPDLGHYALFEDTEGNRVAIHSMA